MLPQVEEVIKEFRQIHFGIIDADEATEIAGHFGIFTVPVLLLFVHGKEYLREARIVHLNLFQKKIKRIYESVLN
ncbi:thioredoxin family protein [Neobacillus sp. PS2-9]|uniref:thioredoxin family protein n=1 Tax=Neobacillus sp. PS2-9 TaxID=3070676 RepID=UPI0027E085BB|nr:thioredoxin family protein [Neobacillus sp. PS2-9]WML60780.1 thioredoxin family protein [Neobacillus sp. PS2-9]